MQDRRETSSAVTTTADAGQVRKSAVTSQNMRNIYEVHDFINTFMSNTNI
jgi:hypothetical protein